MFIKYFPSVGQYLERSLRRKGDYSRSVVRTDCCANVNHLTSDSIMIRHTL